MLPAGPAWRASCSSQATSPGTAGTTTPATQGTASPATATAGATPLATASPATARATRVTASPATATRAAVPAGMPIHPVCFACSAHCLPEFMRLMCAFLDWVCAAAAGVCALSTPCLRPCLVTHPVCAWRRRSGHSGRSESGHSSGRSGRSESGHSYSGDSNSGRSSGHRSGHSGHSDSGRSDSGYAFDTRQQHVLPSWASAAYIAFLDWVCA